MLNHTNNSTGHANGGGTSPSSNGGVSGTSTNGADTNGALNGSAFASDSNYVNYAQGLVALNMSILGSGMPQAIKSTVSDTLQMKKLIGPNPGPNTQSQLADIVNGTAMVRDGWLKVTEATIGMVSGVLNLEDHPNQIPLGLCSCEGDALEPQAVSVEPTAKVATEEPESPPDTQIITDLDTGVTVTSTSAMEINLDAGVKVVTPVVKPNQPVRLYGLVREPGLMVVTIPRGETPAVTTSKAEKTILDPICIADRNDARATLVSDDKELIRVGSSALPAGEYDMFSIYPTGEVSQVNDVTITVVDGEVSDAVEAAFEDTLKIVSTDAQKPLALDTVQPIATAVEASFDTNLEGQSVERTNIPVVEFENETLLPDEDLTFLALPGVIEAGDRLALLHSSHTPKAVQRGPINEFDIDWRNKSNRMRTVSLVDDTEIVTMPAGSKHDVLKPGYYHLFRLRGDKVDRLTLKPVRVPNKHTVPRLAQLSGFGESTLYKAANNGVIPARCKIEKGVKLYDLYDIAVDAMVAAKKYPKVQRDRSKLQQYLASR